MTQFYDIVKNCKGGLYLNIPAYDSSVINREISIPFNAKKVRISRVYALGIMIDPTLERMYKEGYFRIEPAKEFEAEVQQIFYPIEDKSPVYADEEILTALMKGNRQLVRKMLEESPVSKDQVIVIAREHIDELSHSMITDLEKILSTSLLVEDEATNNE